MKTLEQTLAEIEAVEQVEAEAFLRGDVPRLRELWSDGLVVNSTANLIAGKDILLRLIEDGRLRVKRYERSTQRVSMVAPDLAIATGNETSEIATADFGLIVCSYMNLWGKHSGTWQLCARHVGLIARQRREIR
ncbi:MAG TPA: nuclear transport factor 2 family protein [Candidatus Binataceae bacterium]|nr:nuclear transport factor 2 family protein [Candidatus Binataceae bacterium]